MEGLTINEAAETTGWSPRMLRYIESAGLIELPRTPSGYRIFGPGELPGEVAVGLGLTERDLRDFYGEITIVERVLNPWGVPEQQDNPIVVARGPNRTLQQVWPELAGRN
jgi:hypothetical protein